MDADRWQRVEEIFHAALELEPSRRAAFVDRSCAGDVELRGEVEALLAASPEADDRLGGAVAEALELALESDLASEDLTGQDVGAYRLLRKIGEGGLATVYLAERADQQYRMQVAVKVVKPGMATADILRRLRQERQILATLQHPNIARLLDGGTTGEGRPYFVMEYIDGEPIDDYCDRRGLSVGERLKLFRTVCSAVHHAHQNLIIHRDIKPSNVLVSTDGVPKLLDFGIAKLLKPEQAPGTVARTVTGQRLLTPDYASPEQVRGGPLTTATDVYSLGVMLYQLLTSHPPYRLRSGRPQEIEQVICGEEPRRPSTAVARSAPSEGVRRRYGESLSRLRRRLAGDLDNIVLMALRKEPGRRYASAELFSQDLGRHLDSRPVIARGDTLVYRTGKFVRRHRVSVAVAAALAMVLLGGVISTMRATWIANAERARAERHLAEARQLERFLTEAFEISNPGEVRGKEVTAREILDIGAARIAFEFRDRPLVRAKLMTTIGGVYQKHGLMAKARELLEGALDVYRGSLEADDPSVVLGLSMVADVVADAGDHDAAWVFAEEALAALSRRLDGTHPDIAASLALLGGFLRRLKDFEHAEDLYRQSLAMRRELLGEHHPDTVDSLEGLAETLYQKHDYDAAEVLFRQVLAERLQLHSEYHPKVARARNNLAVVLDKRGDHAGAEAEFREVLALRLEIYGDEHTAVAASCNNLAMVLRDQERFEEAEDLLRQALEIYRRVLDDVDDKHPRTLRTMSNLALVLKNLGHLEEAEKMFQKVLDTRRGELGEEDRDVARSLFQLATLREVQGRSADAIRLFEEALRIQRKVLKPGDYAFSFTLIQLGNLLADRGDCRSAVPLLLEAVEIRRDSLPGDPEHPARIAADEALERCAGAM